MKKAATHPELQKAFEDHRTQTEKLVERLEQIFEDLEVGPRGKKCVGMEGLIEEGSELIEEDPDPNVLDAGLISNVDSITWHSKSTTTPPLLAENGVYSVSDGSEFLVWCLLRRLVRWGVVHWCREKLETLRFTFNTTEFYGMTLLRR